MSISVFLNFLFTCYKKERVTCEFLFHTKTCHFPPWLLDLALAENTIIIILLSALLRLERQQKDFLKSMSNSHITLSFLLTHLEI